jgi:peptidoglycan/xylan/chitin deacetylase (PgdA/CDA1 family)
MPFLALKIDVDTLRGTREGVPRLVELLTRLDVPATFLFSVGPDHTGRALFRVFRPGFLSKVARTGVVSNYGLATLLYGTLLPGPQIGTRCRDQMRAAQRAGFEIGVHAYDHVKWQDGVANADRLWTQVQMRLACETFERIFECPATIHGAAGWQLNTHTPELERILGFEFASDTRGDRPFRPRKGGVPQLPTTLPTLDELIGRDLARANPVEELLALTAEPPPHGHVYTLHAELEGAAYLKDFERLLRAWRQQGYSLVSMGQLFKSLDLATLPRFDIVRGTVPGRSGTLAAQGS